MALIGIVLYYALMLYLGVLIVRMVLSWVPLFSPGWQPRGPVLVVAELVYSLTDPPLRLLRRAIPPVTIGSVGLDLGFMILWFAVIVLQRIVLSVFS